MYSFHGFTHWHLLMGDKPVLLSEPVMSRSTGLGVTIEWPLSDYLLLTTRRSQAHRLSSSFYSIQQQPNCDRILPLILYDSTSMVSRGRPKVEISLSDVTESRPKVMYHIRLKPYVPPKVKRDFRPKTETESQSYLSRHDYRSQQVPTSVRCLTISYIWIRWSDIFHIYPPSCQPCGVSLMTRPQGPTVPCRRRQRSRFLGIVSKQWG